MKPNAPISQGLTLIEKNQIKAIKRHLETVDYASFSADAIGKLVRIIERLTECGQ